MTGKATDKTYKLWVRVEGQTDQLQSSWTGKKQEAFNLFDGAAPGWRTSKNYCVTENGRIIKEYDEV